MDFFVDSAHIEEIRQAVAWGLCDGVTTNPSLVAKTGKSFEAVIAEILEIVDGPISLEATATDYEGMLAEARDLASRSEKVVVKLPMTPAGIQTTRTCFQEGIKTNVTLVFSPTQALLAAKAGASYVSPFIGRLDDISSSGMTLIEDLVQIFGNYDFPTRILVASVRHPEHVVDSARLGAHVCTIPFDVLKRFFSHPLTDIGLEKFLKDWEKVPDAS